MPSRGLECKLMGYATRWTTNWRLYNPAWKLKYDLGSRHARETLSWMLYWKRI